MDGLKSEQIPRQREREAQRQLGLNVAEIMQAGELALAAEHRALQLHADAERKLRSRLGLLLVAGKDPHWPPEAEVATAQAARDVKKQGAKTFPANDARKLRQGMAANRAAKFVVEHSTLTPPPAEPVVEELPR